MKKFLGLIVAAALILGFAGQSMAAAFSSANLELIRIVYRTDGSLEVGTDLGNVTTLLGSGGSFGGGTDAFSLGQFGAGASWDNLKVAYVAKNSSGAMQAWLTGTSTPTSGVNKFQAFNAGVAGIITYYDSLGTTSTVVADKGNGNSYYFKLDGNGTKIGQFGGYVPIPTGGEISLASLAAGGYVEQSLYYFGTPNSANQALQGTLVGTIRTYADGHTEVSAVPIPGAIWLLGTGLVGLIGLRRRSA